MAFHVEPPSITLRATVLADVLKKQILNFSLRFGQVIRKLMAFHVELKKHPAECHTRIQR
ncbi:hypothetical protein F4X88_09510 [Candidatus Poribacteria bacterium]|nr:hypothetical protein [Candidatus Poribacteria bacterium]MXV85601.1 hypothetical protein [Candidatus Poribacteria bacterium]MYA56519.1 hypothetical protein [Candidatus Poribacteria bacterium]